MADLLWQSVPRICALAAELDPDRRGAVQRAWWLWVGLVALGLLMILMVAAASRRRRMMARTGDLKAPVRPIKNAWEEAGKRVEPLPADDLSPGDGP